MFSAVRDAVRRALVESAGHVLVFPPGAGEIRAVMELLDDTARAQGLLVLPLHGQLPPEQQDLAVRPS
jgi:ATP-dependent helicase HrpB